MNAANKAAREVNRDGMLSRRSFLALSAAASTAAVAGCATNPVSGRRQLMLVSESQERAMDAEYAPHQFSADYGVSQDKDLNAYLGRVGAGMVPHTHRTKMPYSFQAVNNVVVNGYTLPAGSVALARGLLLAVGNESELAAILGHELGHVNERHAGERMSKTVLAQAAVAGLALVVEREKKEYAPLAAGLGGVGANVLLSRYSREDEREADSLGLRYMTAAGHNPGGMAGVMQTFMQLHDSRPGAVELLFATHPLSEERYHNAVREAAARYAAAASAPVNRERYMDHTARLRAIGGAIEAMQDGQKEMMARRYPQAREKFAAALRQAPDDYAGLLLMSKCHLAGGDKDAARGYAEQARAVYPGEPQADHVLGMCRLQAGAYHEALAAFRSYENRLPGNPNTIFFQGLCLDRMGRKQAAAAEYARYRRVAPNGAHTGRAEQRLAEWGYFSVPR